MSEVVNTVQCEMPDGLKMTTFEGDHSSKFYQAGKYYEASMLEYIETLPDGLNYVDAGAYIGGHTLYFSYKCNASHVYSFEPNGTSCELLTENVKQNDISNVTVYRLALGAAPGTGSIVEGPPNNGGMARVNMSVNGGVQVVRLDDVMADLDFPRIDVIKVDAEGMELEVIKGAITTIARCRPHLFIEMEGNSDIEPWLSNFGYKLKKMFNNTMTGYFAHPQTGTRPDPIFELDMIDKESKRIDERIVLEKVIKRCEPVKDLYWKYVEATMCIRDIVQVFSMYETALTNRQIDALIEAGESYEAATHKIIQALEAGRMIANRTIPVSDDEDMRMAA